MCFCFANLRFNLSSPQAQQPRRGSSSGMTPRDLLNSSVSSDVSTRDALYARDAQIGALKDKVRQLEQVCSRSCDNL